MQNVKAVSTPFDCHLKLSSDSCQHLDEDIDYMSRVPYSSIVESLMYAMVCTHLDLAYVVSRYMANPNKEH